MLKFFPRTYEDEIAYSIFARYGVLNGNTGFRQTSNELFGTKTCSYSVYYSMYLDNFFNQLPVEMGVNFEDFIKRHTIFPLFKPFMTKARAELVIRNMRYEGTRSLKNRMGVNSGDIFNKKGPIITICPLCMKEEVGKYGEAYAHRLHQIPGNFICEKHEVYLEEYPIPTNRNILFDINDAVEEILNDEKNQRITINKITKIINYYGLNNSKAMEKLTNTKKLLSLKCETIEQYHDRIQQNS